MAGRKAKVYDEKNSKAVEALSALGLTHEEIAAEIGVSRPVLDRLYAAELERGQRRVKKKVVGKLLELIDNGDKAAIFFYCKTRLGWKETQNLDVSSTDGSLGQKPLVVTFEYVKAEKRQS